MLTLAAMACCVRPAGGCKTLCRHGGVSSRGGRHGRRTMGERERGRRCCRRRCCWCCELLRCCCCRCCCHRTMGERERGRRCCCRRTMGERERARRCPDRDRPMARPPCERPAPLLRFGQHGHGAGILTPPRKTSPECCATAPPVRLTNPTRHPSMQRNRM